MKRTTGRVAILATVMALAPLPVLAQAGPRGQRAQARTPGSPGVEMILRQRDRLELTDNQVQQLDQIREEAVQRRSAHQAEMAELRSKVLAGEMKAEDLRAQAQARREASQQVREQQHEKVLAVLNDAQKQKVEEWSLAARAFHRGRMSAMRGQRQGMRGRGMMRGDRGMMRGDRGMMRGMRQPWGPGQFRRGPGGGLGFGPPGGFGPGQGFGPPPDTVPPVGSGPGT